MIKDKKKYRSILAIRETILSSARERLKNFSLFVVDDTKKKVDRWEKKAEKEREKALWARQEALKQKILADSGYTVPPLAREVKKEIVLPTVKEEIKVERVQSNKPRTLPRWDPFVSDSQGTVIGDIEEEAPRRCSWIYGGRRYQLR